MPFLFSRCPKAARGAQLFLSFSSPSMCSAWMGTLMEARVSCLCRSARGTGAACRGHLPHVLIVSLRLGAYAWGNCPCRCLRALSFKSLSVAVVLRGHGRVSTAAVPEVVRSCARRQRDAAIVRSGPCHASSPDLPAGSCLVFQVAIPPRFRVVATPRDASSERSRSRSRHCVSVWCLMESRHPRGHAYPDRPVCVAGGAHACACRATSTRVPRRTAPLTALCREALSKVLLSCSCLGPVCAWSFSSWRDGRSDHLLFGRQSSSHARVRHLLEDELAVCPPRRVAAGCTFLIIVLISSFVFTRDTHH